MELLNEMNGGLEVIQRSLNMYLETKQQHFPRFYFISNDDLLEILGQAKHPVAVSVGRRGGRGRRRRRRFEYCYLLYIHVNTYRCNPT